MAPPIAINSMIQTSAFATSNGIKPSQPGVSLTPSGGLTQCVLPPGLDDKAWHKVCHLIGDVIGQENVSRTYESGALPGPQGETYYGDFYEMRGEGRNTPAGAFRPKTVEDIQHIFKVANEYNVPLWVISRGKNLGYGSSTALEKGTVMLDLQRMKKIIEVNEESAFAIVEPGVSFFDLYDYVKDHKLKLWISCPAIGWGSVLGNTTERGFGYTAYGEHSQQQCGMEVVLPNGQVLRSGMGALEGSDMWARFKGGFGPSIDGLFYQSNLGVVTKMGIHLQPAPEHYLNCQVSVPKEEDLPVLTSIVSSLQRSMIIQNHAIFLNTFRQLLQVCGPKVFGPLYGPYWARGEAVPYDLIDGKAKELGLGYWLCEFALYGSKTICEAAWGEVQAAFKNVPGVKFDGVPVEGKSEGGPILSSEMPHLLIPFSGYPTPYPVELMDCRGSPGGHTCFSPLFPTDGKQMYDWYLRSKKMVEDAKIDYFADMHVWGRHCIAIIVLIYGPGGGPRIDRLYKALLEDAAREGITEYRTHIDYMDEIAGNFNFNNGAQRTFIQNIKDITDPNGILSQGKSGLWNAGHKKTTPEPIL